MCHRTKEENQSRRYKNGYGYDDGDVPEADTNPYKNVEPLPESSRERRDGPGGE